MCDSWRSIFHEECGYPVSAGCWGYREQHSVCVIARGAPQGMRASHERWTLSIQRATVKRAGLSKAGSFPLPLPNLGDFHCCPQLFCCPFLPWVQFHLLCVSQDELPKVMPLLLLDSYSLPEKSPKCQKRQNQQKGLDPGKNSVNLFSIRISVTLTL